MKKVMSSFREVETKNEHECTCLYSSEELSRIMMKSGFEEMKNHAKIIIEKVFGNRPRVGVGRRNMFVLFFQFFGR